MEKLIRSRNKKENHITINIKGPEAITIGNAIRKALREMECPKRDKLQHHNEGFPSIGSTGS